MNYIIKFNGTENDFMSNYYPSKIELTHFPIDKEVIIEPMTYETVEHAFQAAKTHDVTERKLIGSTGTPGAAKRLGRKCKLRDDWETVKDKVMLFCLRKKFVIPKLREKLLATEDAILIEGTRWHDSYWGVCYCEKCKGVGRNMLGKLLMKVRAEIKEKDNIVEVAMRISKSLTKEQRNDLLLIADECKNLNGIKEHLSPLYASCLFSDREPTEDEKEYARKLMKKDELK